MNLEQVAAVEEKWLNKQRNLVGDREALYERDGVYAAVAGCVRAVCGPRATG